MNAMKCLLAMGFAMWSAFAAADGPHFTFTVPLALSNLPPEVNRYLVRCGVRQAGVAAGVGRTFGSITGGSFSGDVVVPVTVYASKNPGLVDAYSCHLELMGSADPTVTGGTQIVFLGDGRVTFPLAAGAPFVQNTAVRPLPR